MAERKSSKRAAKDDLSRGTETGAPVERAPIPDPLGDDEHVVASGRLTGGDREHEGLLRSGMTPLPDGGVEEHPIHDSGLEDLGPEEYEEQFEEAPNTGFEPRDGDEGETAEEAPSNRTTERRG